jgi:hypothetical protein
MRAYEPVAVVRAGSAEVPNLPAARGGHRPAPRELDSNHHRSPSIVQCPRAQPAVLTPISGHQVMGGIVANTLVPS